MNETRIPSTPPSPSTIPIEKPGKPPEERARRRKRRKRNPKPGADAPSEGDEDRGKNLDIRA